MIEITVSADVEEAKKQLYRIERQAIPRALSRSINTTMRNARTAVNRRIAQKTGLQIKELKAEQTLIKSTQFTQRSILFNHQRRPVNVIRFVSKARRRRGAFAKQGGVIANPWKQRRLFDGTFIIHGKTHGRPIVVVRTGRTRSGLRGVYGPSLNREIVKPDIKLLLRNTVAARFPINFRRDLNYYLQRVK